MQILAYGARLAQAAVFILPSVSGDMDMPNHNYIDDTSRVPLAEPFEIEAAVRAYRNLGYPADEVMEQMALIFSFDAEKVRPLLRAA